MVRVICISAIGVLGIAARADVTGIRNAVAAAPRGYFVEGAAGGFGTKTAGQKFENILFGAATAKSSGVVPPETVQGGEETCGLTSISGPGLDCGAASDGIILRDTPGFRISHDSSMSPVGITAAGADALIGFFEESDGRERITRSATSGESGTNTPCGTAAPLNCGPIRGANSVPVTIINPDSAAELKPDGSESPFDSAHDDGAAGAGETVRPAITEGIPARETNSYLLLLAGLAWLGIAERRLRLRQPRSSLRD